MAIDYSWIYDDSVYKTLIVRLWHPNGDGTFFNYEWSTEEFVYIDSQDRAHKVEGVIKNSPALSSSLESDSSGSNLTLLNWTVTDENGTPVGTYFDDLINSPIEGKKLVIYLVDYLRVVDSGAYEEENSGGDDSIVNAKKVYFGEVSSVSATDESVTLGLSNLIEELDKDLQRYDSDFYQETQLPGQVSTQVPKPIAYGYCYNVSPVLLDTSYVSAEFPAGGTLMQVANGEVYQIDQVRENGNVIWDVQYGNGALVNEGVYVDVTNGTILLENGTFEGHGVITCDLYGTIQPANYGTQGVAPKSPSVHNVTNASTIAQHLIQRGIGFSELAIGWVNWESFWALEEELFNEGAQHADPLQVGIYITEVTPIRAIVEEILASVHAYLYLDIYNRISVARFKVYDVEDENIPTHNIKQDMILDGSYTLDVTELPNISLPLTYRHNYTPQSLDSLAYVLAPDDPDAYDIRPEFVAENRTVTVINYGEEVSLYPTAISADTVNTLLRFESSATIEANARMETRSVKRRIYSLKARNAAIDMRIGDYIKIQHYLYNSNSPVFGTIIGLTWDFVNMITTIEVFV